MNAVSNKFTPATLQNFSHWNQAVLRSKRPRGHLLYRLDQNSRAVRQDFGHALHDLGRIVARADNRIAAEFRSVLQHQIEGFCPRLFAELGEQSGVPARKLSEPPPG